MLKEFYEHASSELIDELVEGTVEKLESNGVKVTQEQLITIRENCIRILMATACEM